MIASEYDPVVPRQQLDDMRCALQSKGISRSLYQVMLLSYSDLHSFNYWQSCDQLPLDANGCTEVRDDVIQFLDSHLKVTHPDNNENHAIFCLIGDSCHVLFAGLGRKCDLELEPRDERVE